MFFFLFREKKLTLTEAAQLPEACWPNGIQGFALNCANETALEVFIVSACVVDGGDLEITKERDSNGIISVLNSTKTCQSVPKTR